MALLSRLFGTALPEIALFRSEHNVAVELVLGGAFVFPLSVFVGFVSRRLAIKTKRWSLSLLFFGGIADVAIEFFLHYPIAPFRGLFRLVVSTLGCYIGESFQPVALTGSIATGKSTVVRLLQNHKIIDSDSIGHEILLPPDRITDAHSVSPSDSVYFQVLQQFGDDSLQNKNILDDDGLVDRRKLGAVIFQDRTLRRKLNAITHPRIIWSLLKQLVAGLYWERRDIVLADVPLLFESGKLRWLFALTTVVSCTADQQYQRLRTRNRDLSDQQCRDRIASQIPIDRKVHMADLCIDNTGTVNDLKAAVASTETELRRRLRCGGLSLSATMAFIGIATFFSQQQ